MHFELSESDQISKYEEFLAKLGRLSFCVVDFVMVPRKNISAFIGADGQLITSDMPWFGAEYAKLGKDGQERADKMHCYYDGQSISDAGEEVYFCKKSRDVGEKTCFLPVSPSDWRFTPRAGDVLFGQIDDGPKGKKFCWWDKASLADKRFADFLCGRAEFSSKKLEGKLTVTQNGHPNRFLFLLVQALKKEPDLDFFVDLARKGELSQGNNEGLPIGQWLNRYVSEIRPDFWRTFKEAVRKPMESCSPSPLALAGV